MESPSLSANNAIDISENTDVLKLFHAFIKKLNEKNETIRRLEQTIANMNKTI